MKIYISFLLISFSFSSFCQKNPDLQHMKNEINPYPIKEEAHPKSKKLLKEDFLYSLSDISSPFGSDDAADTYAHFAKWKVQNSHKSPKNFLNNHLENWGYELFDLKITKYEDIYPYLKKSKMHVRYQLGIDQVIIAIAFGELHLEGKIHIEIKDLAKDALTRQLNSKMLALWDENYIEERKRKLTKMQEIINQVK